MKYNCFVSFLCGMMFLPVVGLGIILAQPLPVIDDPLQDSPLMKQLQVHMNPAINPEGLMAPIHIDADGYVICSTEKKP
jgi:hypothetical protein